MRAVLLDYFIDEEKEAAQRNCVIEVQCQNSEVVTKLGLKPSTPDQGLHRCALLGRSRVAECSWVQTVESALFQSLASSLLPALSDFGKVTLNFCLFFYKREK